MSDRSDEFEERAAIAEYDGGLSRDEAEELAARRQGFKSAAEFWMAERKRSIRGVICE